MKTNLRKEQEKLAVLLEISDTPKKNSDIIKGAESRLIMDEAYTRLLSDKKTTAGKKELQFILYFEKLNEMSGDSVYKYVADICVDEEDF